MVLPARAPIGQRLKAARKDKTLTQKALAEEIGISVSYLNLIENNKRVIGGALLRDLASRLDLDLDSLTGTRETRLIGEMQIILSDPNVRKTAVGEGYLADFVGRFPDLADLLQRLYEQWQARLETDELLSARIRSDSSLREIGHQIITHITALRSFSEILADGGSLEPDQRARFQAIVANEATELSTLSRDFFSALSNLEQSGRARSPTDEVADLFSASNQYFHTIEQEADAWRVTWPKPLTLEEAREALTHMPSPSIDTIIAETDFEDPSAVTLAYQALRAYKARAALMPYESFFGALNDTRLDVDRLAVQFRVPVGDVCERIASLRQPDSAAPLAAFLRIDLAGNIATRVSNAVLNIPRYGGACPLWAVYRAILNPGRTLAQRVEISPGRELLFIANTDLGPTDAYGAPRQISSVMLALDWAEGRNTVYGSSLAGRPAIPIGPTCRFCTRANCKHRFEPSSLGLDS